MKSKIYEFDPVIYPFPLLITKQFDEEEMKNTFDAINSNEQNVPCTDEFTRNGCVTARVLCLMNKKTEKMYYMILLFRPKCIGDGIVTHESIHLANAYLQYLGFSAAKAYDDEQYAYFGGWIANCIQSVLRNEPKKMKGTIYGNDTDATKSI